jgi:hypothetical protein
MPNQFQYSQAVRCAVNALSVDIKSSLQKAAIDGDPLGEPLDKIIRMTSGRDSWSSGKRELAGTTRRVAHAEKKGTKPAPQDIARMNELSEKFMALRIVTLAPKFGRQPSAQP